MAAVFDADTNLARDVDARLNREAHAFFDDHVVAFRNGWEFVNIHTDAVAKTVVEILTIARFFDDLPSSAIYFMSCDTWLDKVKSSLLGFQCQIVDILFELGRLANSNGPPRSKSRRALFSTLLAPGMPCGLAALFPVSTMVSKLIS